MPDPDLEQLRQRILENLEALDQILHRQAEQEPARPQLRLLKGGALGAALLAGAGWLRRHREVPVALVVAVVAAVAAWLLWPDDEQLGQSPGRTPPATVTIRETSVSSLPTPSTAAPTLTQPPGGRPSPTPRVTPTTGPTGQSTVTEPTGRSPVPTERTIMPPERTTAPTMRPTQPTTQPSTRPPTQPTATPPPPVRPTPFCITVMPGQGRVWVCKTGLLRLRP